MSHHDVVQIIPSKGNSSSNNYTLRSFICMLFVSVGKSKTKVSKHGSAQEGNVTQTVASEKLNVGSKQSFNGISTTPGTGTNPNCR